MISGNIFKLIFYSKSFSSVLRSNSTSKRLILLKWMLNILSHFILVVVVLFFLVGGLFVCFFLILDSCSIKLKKKKKAGQSILLSLKLDSNFFYKFK